jgi:sigma-B regulation protein RsbU (phosphoserine phosphatase)
VTHDDPAGAALAMLVRRTHLMAPDELPTAADDAARLIGAQGCRIHLIARDQAAVVPLGLGGEGCGEPLRLDGTLAGRSFRATEIVASADGTRLWVPLLDGTERVGVLEVLVDGLDGSDRVRDAAETLAGLIAGLVVSKAQYTDSFERARRALPMGVAAEMLWRQLPPMTFATGRFVIAAQLEPWHQVGGDAFDYSIDGDTLRFAVFDGMGHGLGATLLASVALAAYRNARRAGLGLVETARAVDEVLGAQFGEDSFVTAVLAELDLRDGTVCILSAAHPAPLLVRDGRAVRELDAEPGVPLGFGGRDDTVARTSLQPGDRIVMFSDGVTEARSPEGVFFGTDRLVDLLARAESLAQPPPETLRRLVVAVLEHQEGMLQDDATLLMLEWAGDPAAILPA